MPYLLGLTGGIASGKNAVAAMLTRHGADVVDADQVSRDLVAPGTPLLAAITAQWGDGLVDRDGALDRKALAARVFGKPEEVRRLNALTHPAILAEMGERAARSPHDVVIFMAPLLFEAGADRLVDEIWIVTANEDTRIRRVLARDGGAEGDVRARIAAQIAPAEGMRRAHVVIHNDRDLRDTERQVEAAWQQMQLRRTSVSERQKP